MKRVKYQNRIKKSLFLLLFLFVFTLTGCDLIDEWLKDVVEDPYEILPLEEYYEGAVGLTGNVLRDYLEELISSNVKGVTYGEAKVALAEADVHPEDDTKVLTIYSREAAPREWISGNAGWTREHVWPNSRLGLDRVEEKQVNQASDLHNLRAIIQSVNSSRGNKFFDDTTDANSYFPGNDDKGDVARILFYMVIRYPFLELVDYDLPDDDSAYEPRGAKMSKMSRLLEWHKEDPVDDFERQRNEVIYKWQGNRNPFIDHPEFVRMVFESATTSKRSEEPKLVAIIIDLRKESIFYA